MVLNIERKDFVIDKTIDGYRVKRVDIEGNLHSHLKSKSTCESIINNIINKKIPRNVGNYYLTSLIRLSNDLQYINKIQTLINTRDNKGKKQYYFNPSRKSG